MDLDFQATLIVVLLPVLLLRLCDGQRRGYPSRVTKHAPCGLESDRTEGDVRGRNRDRHKQIGGL